MTENSIESALMIMLSIADEYNSDKGKLLQFGPDPPMKGR